MNALKSIQMTKIFTRFNECLSIERSFLILLCLGRKWSEKVLKPKKIRKIFKFKKLSLFFRISHHPSYVYHGSVCLDVGGESKFLRLAKSCNRSGKTGLVEPVESAAFGRFALLHSGTFVFLIVLSSSSKLFLIYIPADWNKKNIYIPVKKSPSLSPTNNC